MKNKPVSKLYRAAFYLLLASILVFIYSSAYARSEANALIGAERLLSIHAQSGARLRVGVYNFKPLIFMGENGTAQGLYIDVLNYIAKQEGWTIDYVLCTWSECLASVEAGELDILPSVGHTEERAQKLDFTQDFLFLDWGVLYRNNTQSIATILDLEGKRIAALKGSIYTEGLRRLLEQFGIHADIIEKSEYTEVLTAVNSGEVDAGVITKVYGLELEGNYRNIQYTEIFFSPVKIYFALPKGKNPDLLATLNRYFADLKGAKNSYYYQSLNKWMNFYQKPTGLPLWTLWILAALGVAFVAALLFSITLRRQVFTRTQSLVMEIQERKQVEEALLKSEARFRVMFEQAAVGVGQIETASGRFIRINQKYCDIVGYPRAEMENLDFQTISHPDDLKIDLANMERLKSGEIREFTMEKRYLKKSGETVWVSLTVSPMWSAGALPDYHIAIAEDITARKQAEEALRESEARFATIFHTNPVRVAITRFEDGLFLDVNDNFLTSSGYTREEVIGHTSHDLNNWVNPAERIRLHRMVEEQRPVWNFETQLRQKSGQTRDVLMSADMIQLFGQRCILSVAVDITERKQAEAAVIEKANDLERFNNLMVGRELRMIELKKEINALCAQAGQPPRYALDFAQTPET